MTWSELVRETRSRLGATRPEFARLLGITLGTLDSWEYKNAIARPLYQSMIACLYNNSEELKNEFLANKSFYLKRYIDPRDRELWKDVIEGKAMVGVVALLLHSKREKYVV